MPDEFGGVEIQEPEKDEFGGIVVDETTVPRGTIPSLPRTESVFDRALRFLKPVIMPPSGLAIGANLQPAQVQRVERGIYAPVQKAGEVAEEAFLPAVSQRLREMGIDPSSSPERVINLPRLSEKDFPGSPAPGIAAGLQNLAAGTTESLVQSGPLLLAGTGEGAIARIAAGVFTSQQFAQLPDQIQEAVRVLADPKSTKAEKVEAIGKPGVSALMVAGGTHAALRPMPETTVGALRRQLEAPPRVSATEPTPIVQPGRRMVVPPPGMATLEQAQAFKEAGQPIRRSLEETRIPPEAPQGQPTYPPSGLGRPTTTPTVEPQVRPNVQAQVNAGINPDDIRITVQQPQVPGDAGYVQVDEIHPELGNTFSSNPEELKKAGFNIPSTDELKQLAAGRYTLSDARAKLKAIPKRPEDFEPAILVNDKPVTGGESHKSVSENALKAATNADEQADILEAAADDQKHVFVDKNKKVYTRRQAADALKEKEPLQSERLNELKAGKPLRLLKEPKTPAPPQPEVSQEPVGMGAAVKSEFEKTPQTPTGIRNAVVDQERIKRGLPSAMEPARRTFGEVWDRAMAMIDRDPVAQDRLINELMRKPRALTDVEDALLLHRQVDLQNDYGKATRDLAQAYDDGREWGVTEGRARVAELADKLFDLYNVGKTAGTETARGLSARRMMVNEDFSLANMVVQKRAALGGRRLTPQETTKTETNAGKIAQAQGAWDTHLARQRTKTSTTTYDIQTERLRANVEREKNRFNLELAADRLAQRPPHIRAMDWLTKWRRAFVLSSPITLGKLVAASIQRMTLTPAEELVGSALEKLIPSVASKTGREGGLNIKAEAKALTSGITQGMQDSWDVLRTGRSSLDEVYGRASGYPPAVSDFFGHVHGALKSFTKRNEFARSFEKRAASAMAAGVDVSDPAVQMKLGIESYKDANRSIFQQDNRVVSAYKALIGSLERKPTLPSKTVATALKVALPIVKIPTNIVAETFQMATGSVTGSVRLGRAFARGIENLKQDEADIIMRNLKKGSLGAAVLALGWFNADVIGGYYQPGKKRDPGDVKAGRIRLYGEEIPSWLLHHPLLETLQIGATARRVAEAKFSRNDTEAKGIGWGLLGAGIGTLEEVPFVRESSEVGKAFQAPDQRAFLGELAKSIVVPQGVQWWAALRDVDQYGEPIARKPKTIAEHVKTGIPGLRKEVPAKK